MRRTMTYAAIAVLAGAGALTAVPAQAAVPAAEFGQHVSMHARDGLLGQEHHPGMHQGKAGWEDHHEHMGSMS